MKVLKFLLAGCLVLAGIGVVGTGVTLGEVYKNNQTVYEASESATLNQAALENVYIESDVPVRIMPTEGKARVEFEASGHGLMIPEPKYKLDVTSEGKSSYINLKEVQGPEVYLFTNNIRQELTVYLPEKDMNTLKVVTNTLNYHKSFSYASKANINDLVLNVGAIDLDLEGNYNQVDIRSRNSGNGSIKIHSNTPAVMYIEGDCNTNLTGQIQQVHVKNIYNSDGETININSDLEAKIKVDNRYSDVLIEGKVKDITMNTQGGNLFVDSNTSYNILINASDYVDTNLKGMIETATIESEYGNVRLYPTGTPKRIEVLGNDVNVHAVLPADISGFEIKRKTEGYAEEDMNNFYTDFEVKSETMGEQLKRIYFGDEAMKMYISSMYGEVYVTR